MPNTTGIDTTHKLAQRLKRENIPFALEVPIGGVRVDFAFWAPDKQLIIAELKAWEPTRENLDRAMHQVELYKQRTGAVAAYVVIPGIEHGQPEHGLVSGDELVRLLSEKYQGTHAKQGPARGALHVAPKAGLWLLRSSATGGRVSSHGTQAEAVEAGRLIARSAQAKLVIHGRESRNVSRGPYEPDALRHKGRVPLPAARRRPAVAIRKAAKAAAKKPGPSGRVKVPFKRAPKKIFAAMPFSSEYDDVFMVAMAKAADDTHAVCERVDHQAYSGDAVERIKLMIRQSSAVIVDLSGARPNVLYEAGFAEALKIKTIYICSTPLGELPFDVRNHRTLSYNRGQTYKLTRVLTRELKAIMDSHRVVNRLTRRSLKR